MRYEGVVAITGKDPLVQDAERAPSSSRPQSVGRQPAGALTGRHRGQSQGDADQYYACRSERDFT